MNTAQSYPLAISIHYISFPMAMINLIAIGNYHAKMPTSPYPSRVADQFQIRFPDGMRDRIAEAAKASGRSMNAEIVARLQQSFDAPDDVDFETEFEERLLELRLEAVRENMRVQRLYRDVAAARLQALAEQEPTDQLARAAAVCGEIDSELAELSARLEEITAKLQLFESKRHVASSKRLKRIDAHADKVIEEELYASLSQQHKVVDTLRALGATDADFEQAHEAEEERRRTMTKYRLSRFGVVHQTLEDAKAADPFTSLDAPHEGQGGALSPLQKKPRK